MAINHTVDEDQAELNAFLARVGEVVERAIHLELEHFERTHLGTYRHEPAAGRDVEHE